MSRIRKAQVPTAAGRNKKHEDVLDFLWHDPLEWLYPDRLDSLKPALKAPCFEVPRGSFASIAFVLTGLTPGRKVILATDDRHCRLYAMADVCVNLNTAEISFAEREDNPKSKSVTRNAPFRVYDVLRPLDGTFIPGSGCAAFYLQRPVGYRERPGTLKIQLKIQSGEEIRTETCSFRISPAALPRTGRRSVIMTNWLDPINFVFPAPIKLWSPRFWKLTVRHAALMHHMRQNMFLVPLNLFVQYDRKNGTFSLLEKELKKWIRIFTDAGLYWIEGGHFGIRAGSWFTTEFQVIHSSNPARSPEGSRDIAQIALQLRDFIDRNGLRDRWFQHVADEPIECNADSYRIFVGIVRKYLPGIPIVEALGDLKIAGAVDVWCPQVQVYQKDRDGFEQTRLQGDRIWVYTCCNPGGPWLNRLCDEDLTRPLLLGWGCGLYGLEGFLHWGWNQYRHYTSPDRAPIQDPYEETAPLHKDGAVSHLPPGDTHIVYPGPRGEIYPSLRLEAQREGLEDWELIRMLRKLAPRKCDPIIRQVFRTFADFTPDPKAIRQARSALLRALEKQDRRS